MKKLFFVFLFLVTSLMIRAQTDTQSCPCCGPEFRQFDFWLGDWEAYTGDKLAGTNRIVLLQDSCIVQENWVSAAGPYTGTSYNFFNPQTGKWHQTWIDNQGGSLLLRGMWENGKMILYSDVMKNQQGQPYINRITWTPNADGTVRQHWEVSGDEGKTWTAVFDGLYKPKG